VIHENMEKQIYHIQKLLDDKLNRYKEKGNVQVKEYIWEIQEVYYKLR